MITPRSKLPWSYNEKLEITTDAHNMIVMGNCSNTVSYLLEEDQQAIVTAVNCHNELLDALKATVLLLEYQNNYHDLNTTGLIILSQAKAVIAKALNQQQ